MKRTDDDGLRRVETVLPSQETYDGAGVRLRRAFGYREVPRLDPFLLLDDFRSDDPADYIAGFPWHPHRGIETVTYMLDGQVEHGDSIGNAGVIGPGDVQWMTAGSGIIHQEMPKQTGGCMGGFQLWVNLPASRKMMKPRYQDVKSAQIPEVKVSKGVTARVICGEVAGVRGPVRDIVAGPEYLDISVSPRSAFRHAVRRGQRAFAYVLDGKGAFDGESGAVERGNLVIFNDGDRVEVSTLGRPVRFLLVSGRPLGEPVAWGGPIVMNTRQELERAFEEYENGGFVKSSRRAGGRRGHPF